MKLSKEWIFNDHDKPLECTKKSWKNPGSKLTYKDGRIPLQIMFLLMTDVDLTLWFQHSQIAQTPHIVVL